MLVALSLQFCQTGNLHVVLLCLVCAGLKLDLLHDVRGLRGYVCLRVEMAAGGRRQAGGTALSSRPGRSARRSM